MVPSSGVTTGVPQLRAQTSVTFTGSVTLFR